MKQMTDNEIMVAIARVEGWEPDYRYKPGGTVSGIHWKKEGCQWRYFYELPDYLNSHDALAPVLAGLDGGGFARYMIELARSVGGCDLDECCIEDLLFATPRQKCEALLRAKGLWA